MATELPVIPKTLIHPFFIHRFHRESILHYVFVCKLDIVCMSPFAMFVHHVLTVYYVVTLCGT